MLTKGQAAVIVEHSYHLGNTEAGGLSFCPGGRGVEDRGSYCR